MSQDDKEVEVPEEEGAEDIEAFLKSLEEAEVPDIEPGSAKPVATAPDTEDLDARFAALNDLVPDELPAKQAKPEKAAGPPGEGSNDDAKDGKKKSRKERAAEKKAAKARAKQEAKEAKERAKQEKIKAKEAAAAAMPAWKRFAKKGGLWALMILPMLVFVWIVGAFLAHVISAGWLIALLALILAIGLPLLVAKLSKRGKPTWWAAGLGVLLTVLLIAPMPKTVGDTLTEYGYWPASAVGEVANWEADNALANVGAAVSRLFGSALGAEASGALKLGSKDRLDGSVIPETQLDAEPSIEPVDEVEPATPDSPGGLPE